MPLFLMAIPIAVQTAIMVAILYLAHYLLIRVSRVRTPDGVPIQNPCNLNDYKGFVIFSMF